MTTDALVADPRTSSSRSHDSSNSISIRNPLHTDPLYTRNPVIRASEAIQSRAVGRPSAMGGSMISLTEDDRVAFETGSHQTTHRKFSGDTWTRYVEYLRDNIPPVGPTARALKAKIEKGYRWDKQRNVLIYKAGNLIAVHEGQIFDIIAREYQNLQFRGCYSLWRAVRDKYHGILQEDTKRFITLCKNRERPINGNDDPPIQDDRQDHRPITRFSDIARCAEQGRQYPEEMDEVGEPSPFSNDDGFEDGIGWPEEDGLPLPDIYYDSGGYQYPHREEDRCPRALSKETQECLYWLEDMNDREWPPSIETSHYRGLIAGLYTILQKAQPARTFVMDYETQSGVDARSYKIADLLCLTMEEATEELGTSSGAPRPIFINASPETTRDLGTIENCLKITRQFIDTLTVQDLSQDRTDPIDVPWPTSQVLEHFGQWAKDPEDQPPIHIQDLGIVGINGVPDCFSTEDMIFLMKFRSTTIGRPIDPLGSFWHQVEKWRLLGQRGSGIMAHQPHSGFWTWLKMEEGKKLFLLCHPTQDDRLRFAAEGTSFTGGRWSYLWLEPGQILVLPPGYVHAVFSPEDTLCVGGNAWSQRRIGDSMRAISFEVKYPNAVRKGTVAGLGEILERVESHMEGVVEGGKLDALERYGGEEGVEVFRHYYKDYLRTTERPKAPQNATATTITVATTTVQPPASPTGRRSKRVAAAAAAAAAADTDKELPRRTRYSGRKRGLDPEDVVMEDG